MPLVQTIGALWHVTNFKLIFRPTVDAKWRKWINVNQQSWTMEVQRQLELDAIEKRHL